jgi:Flp pilus assembly protein TadG
VQQKDSMMRIIHSKPVRRGTACVEFAVVLPMLLIFILGILEIGRYVEVYQILEAAAREGARQASTGQMTNAQVISAVTGCVQAAGLPRRRSSTTCR